MAVTTMQRGWARARLPERGALMLVALFALLLPISTPRIYATDEVQYYVYLRSLRFDGDLDFANDYQRFAALNPRSGIDTSLLQPNRIRSATGRYGNVAPVGSAIMWSPFFLLADALVHIADALGAHIPADGFSAPYIDAVCYASALYGLLGLLLTYRLARGYTSQFGATLACAMIWLATPLVFYMFVQMPWSHATGFFLVALFLTIWQHTRAPGGRSLGAWVALGVVGGLMAMTREQLGLFLLAPAVEELLRYWRLFRARQAQARELARLALGQAAFLVAFLVAITPQLAAYQALNGRPLPAGEVGDKLSWCSPHLLDTLIDFDPRPSPLCPLPNDPTASFPPFAHGALIWSPALALALLGLPLLWRRDRLLAAVLALLFLAQTYINGAFGSTWHLSGAFGFRRLIECTPIFVVGLALGLDWMAARIDRRWLLAPAALLVAWNLGLALNWTLFNAETHLRSGMTWPDLWRWQLEAPGKALAKVGQLLFHRCSLFDNGGCG